MGRRVGKGLHYDWRWIFRAGKRVSLISRDQNSRRADVRLVVGFIKHIDDNIVCIDVRGPPGTFRSDCYVRIMALLQHQPNGYQ